MKVSINYTGNSATSLVLSTESNHLLLSSPGFFDFFADSNFLEVFSAVSFDFFFDNNFLEVFSAVSFDFFLESNFLVVCSAVVFDFFFDNNFFVTCGESLLGGALDGGRILVKLFLKNPSSSFSHIFHDSPLIAATR